MAAAERPIRQLRSARNATVADLNPKTLDNAKRQFVELYGSALVMNTSLKIALVLVSLIALGLLALNFHTATKYSQVKPVTAFAPAPEAWNPAGQGPSKAALET